MAIIHRGEVLMQGNPLKAIESIKDKMWKKLIDKKELPEYSGKYRLTSTRLQAGRQQINVYADTEPEGGFEHKPANLEDVYFCTIPADEIQQEA
jgi:hypothetical protein